MCQSMIVKTKKRSDYHPQTIENEARTYPKWLKNRCRNWAPEKVGKSDVPDSFQIIDFGPKSDNNPPNRVFLLIFRRRFADFDFSMDFSQIFNEYWLHFDVFLMFFNDYSIDLSSMFLDMFFNEKTYFSTFVFFIKSHSRRGKTHDFT